MATLEEILAYAERRMSPRERAQIGMPRNLFENQGSASLYAGRGIGLGGTIPSTIGGGNNTVVNIPPQQRPAAPAVNPQDAEDQALVRQAGFAEANSDVARVLQNPLTATPFATLAAAVGGYGRGSYAAKQDVAASADKRMEAEAKRQELEAAKAQQAALEAEIAKLPPEQQGRFRLLAGVGAKDRAADVVAPPPVENKVVGDALVNPVTGEAIYQAPGKPQIVGGETGGYYAVDPITGATRQIIGGIGRAPQSEELVSIDTPDGPILVPRSQAVGKRPGSTRDLAGTEGERADKRFLGIVEQIQNGGIDSLTPEDRQWYELNYRERMAPKVGLDPNTGLITSTTADLSFAPLPPSMQPKEAVAPAPVFNPPYGVSPSSGSPEQPAPLKYGPTAGRAPLGQGPTKEQTASFNAAVSAQNDMNAATKRLRDLLAEGGGQTALFGDRATRMKIASQQVVTALGALGNAGVLQPSDIDRFTQMFGDPTSVTGFIGNATGMKPLDSALQELDSVVAERVNNRGREAGRDQVPPPDQRVKDTVYQTPRGPLRWTGTGWLPVAGN